jgi:hypothetical protein
VNAYPLVTLPLAAPVARHHVIARIALHAFALVSAAVCLYSMRRADPDLWGYLAAGRLFLEHGGLTTHDPFAYTSTGLTWVTFEYGAHIALWLAYRGAGPLGLLALKCILGALSLYFLAAAIRVTTRDPHVWVPVFVLCASTLSRFFLFRPQLFTFAFFALFVAVLFRQLLERRAPLWLLPAVMLIWANTHGGFVAGLGAVGLAIGLRAAENLGQEPIGVRRMMTGTKALWVTFGACFAATFVNPMGARLWGYVLTELAHATNRRYTVEWGPASLSTDAWSAVALTLTTGLFLVVAGMACRRGRVMEKGPPPIAWALTCVPVLAMAYVSVRHVPIAAIWVGPVITLLASRAVISAGNSAAFRRTWFVLRGVAALPACLTFAVVLAEPRAAIGADGTVLGSRHPCTAVAFMKENHLAGNVFNPLWWGSYLTWELYPAVRVSMDGRNISLFSDRMVVENFDFYLKDAVTVDADTPLRYDTRMLLIPTDSPVLSRIETDVRWRQAFRDHDSVLFLRAGDQNRSVFIPPTSSCATNLQ